MNPLPVTDEELLVDLRERGLTGPIDADFLASYRSDYEFTRLALQVEAIPGGPERLHRALIQAGVIPPTDVGDQRLLAGWTRYVDTENAYVAASEEEDKLRETAVFAADDVLAICPATTAAGAVVKLCRALMLMTTNRTVQAAILKGDLATVYGMRDALGFPEALVVDALAAAELATTREVAP